MAAWSIDVVVPTLGRPTLKRLLESLAASDGPRPGRVIVVHDGPPGLALAPVDGIEFEVVEGARRGPAAARNLGWRASNADWVAFLDDDVVVSPRWLADLAGDLEAGVTGSQGRIEVPLPLDRAPTDWERNVAGLERARWATADMAFRRDALRAMGGFDERFPRAYREDADLALRLERAGHALGVGRRVVSHPVPDAGRWTSVRLQRGNADDALMRVLHPGWKRPPGRFPRHLAVAAAGVVGMGALALGRRRVGAAALGAWAVGTAEFAWARIAPGPRTRDEVATVTLTSAAIPFAATYHRVAGTLRARKLTRPPAAVLLDRDGTLVEDVPYNGSPAAVRSMPGAREALDRLRAAGIPVAVVSNQSGVGRGLVTPAEVKAVNGRVEELVGPIAHWAVCPHAPEEGCECRKPRAGLVLQAAEALGVAPTDCVVVGDIGADVEAARAAGARAILVPTPETRADEVAAAPEVVPDLLTAVDRLLGARA